MADFIIYVNTRVDTKYIRHSFKGSILNMSLDTYFSQKANMEAKKVGKKSKPKGETSASAMEPSFIEALDNVKVSLTKVIDKKISTVLEAIKEQTSQIQAVATRVEEAEQRIVDVEEAAVSSEARITALEKQVRDLLEHVDDLDNRGRRCNVRIVGLPEGTEGSNPVKFLETWIPQHLRMTVKGDRVKIDRAHRSKAQANSGSKNKTDKQTPNQRERPRPLILKFHNWQDKQRVIDAARLRGARESQSEPTEPNISFFSDYSAGVVRKRRAFDDVKSRLRKINVEYALLYPATLWVTVGGKQKKFVSPKDAEQLAKSLEEGRGDMLCQSMESVDGDKLD